MNKIYDASKEFKPFANRGRGGQLIEEPTFKGHPNKKHFRRATGKPNTSRHAPNRRIRVTVNNDIRQGYTYQKV